MEHRYSDRLNADLNIAIYKQNLMVAMDTVKNISGEGVFIESRYHDMAANQPLEIELFSNESSLIIRRFNAVVVHRNERGFGAEIENVADTIRLAMIREPLSAVRTSGQARLLSAGRFQYAAR